MGILNSIKDSLIKTAKSELANPNLTKKAASLLGGAAKTQPAKPANPKLSGKAASLVGSTAPAKPEPVDVEAVIEAAVKAKGVPSNWRVSIVDLMSALDMDSSLASRKVLAAKLNYTGADPDGSAEKNTWLHKELMKTLAENGGKVPAELRG